VSGSSCSNQKVHQQWQGKNIEASVHLKERQAPMLSKRCIPILFQKNKLPFPLWCKHSRAGATLPVAILVLSAQKDILNISFALIVMNGTESNFLFITKIFKGQKS
jgi:hypothetical protein